MITMLFLACKMDQELQNKGGDPGRNLEPQECDCPDSTADVAALQEELRGLRDRVVELEASAEELTTADAEIEDRIEAIESEPDPEPAADSTVVSTYRVDCNRQTFMYDEYNVEYTARYAAGTLSGFEGIWSACPLVADVEVGSVPVVSVTQVRPLDVDTTCEASYCPNTSADGWWYNANSGGHIVAGGWDDMRMSPGMQLRYDEDRGVIYTSSDYRSVSSGSRDPLWYEVTVIGTKSYTAPDGWY